LSIAWSKPVFSYDRAVQPPAPVLDVLVSCPEEIKSLPVRAMLDSGSSLTALPLRTLRALNAPVYDQLTISGYKDRQARVRTYIVAVEVAGHYLWPLEVTGLPRDDAILGRDVLNQFVVTLDGPALTFEMQLPQWSDQ
jgi:hypothetical protein